MNHQFIEHLRNNNFSISTAELLDSLLILRYATNLTELKVGLRGIFAKSLPQQKLFDLLFDMFIKKNPMKKQLHVLEDELQQEIHAMLDNFENERPHVASQIEPVRLGLGLLVEQRLLSFHSNYKLAIKKIFSEGVEVAAQHILLRYLLPSTNTFSELLKKRERVMSEIQQNLTLMFPQNAEQIMMTLENALQAVIEDAIQLGNDLQLKHNPFSLNPIEDRPLVELDQSLELQQALHLFARRIASRKKWRRNDSQKIDFRRTFRINIQRGGKMIDLVRKRKMKHRPRLIVITDVSPSTMHATRLFLSILGAMKDQFTDIKFFEFIGTAIDVTNEFYRAESVPQAVDKVIEKWNKVQRGKQSSDYQQALSTVLKLARPYLTKKYTVIILGDCRDWLGSWKDGRPASAKYIHSLSVLCKKVLIFNPEPKELWDKGDSVVSFFKESGGIVLETTTLRDLAKNIDLID